MSRGIGAIQQRILDELLAASDDYGLTVVELAKRIAVSDRDTPPPRTRWPTGSWWCSPRNTVAGGVGVGTVAASASPGGRRSTRQSHPV